MDNKTLSALAEPCRFRIVELLREKPLSVNEVARQLKIRQPQSSKHLHTLQKAGLVTSHSFAQQRIYALNPEPFTHLNKWLDEFEHTWSERLTRLDDYLSKLKEG